MKETNPISVRLPADVALWLQTRKEENNRSLNAEVVAAIRAAMETDPLLIYVHKCVVAEGECDGRSHFYDVAVSHNGIFLETTDRKEAFAAARAKAAELGLPRTAVRFAIEDFSKDLLTEAA